jgi:hypothetical protein
MAKTIVFKKEFEDNLKKLKIKTKFLKNLTVESVNKNNGCDLQTIEEVVKFLNFSQSFERFISRSFLWSKSNEGDSYWFHICNK